MPYSSLEINNYNLAVILGVTAKERSNLQHVSLSIKVEFNELPRACKTDNIEDTLCYDSLIQLINKFCENKEFKLIENLTYCIYNLIREKYPKNKIKVKLCKKPSIENLEGDCCFSIS